MAKVGISTADVTWHRMSRMIIDNELEKLGEEIVEASFKELPRYSSRGTL
jgi:hypothetical protein